MSLKRRLAEFGFESNDDFDFVLRCLFESQESHLRVLNPVGDSGRRKTAFANALAHALEYPHVLYHDFSGPEPVAPAVVPGVNAGGEPVVQEASAAELPSEAPLKRFERRIVEASAYSEGARTVLILDQLQAAPFTDQIALSQFASSGQWQDGRARAHRRNLLLIVISEQPLYHSLARLALRVWTDRRSAAFDYAPADFGWPATAQLLFDVIGEVCTLLGQAPTRGETRRLLADLEQRVRTVEQLRLSLYAHIEGVDRGRLYAAELEPALTAVVEQVSALVGVDEIVVGQGGDAETEGDW